MAIYPTYPHNITNENLCRDVRNRGFFDDPMIELLCRRLEELNGDREDEVKRLEDHITDLEHQVYDLEEDLSSARADLLEAEATADSLKSELAGLRAGVPDDLDD